MTDEEREKFDAIRMNLELTGHDLESMRERVDKLVTACEVNRVACEELRRTAESHEHQFQDIREDLLLLRESSASLLVVCRGNERRLEKLEGRIQ